jgi:5-methylcytosine-specific restriction endonuclease McrA
MARNTNVSGDPFDQDKVDAVWERRFGSEEAGEDLCKALIKKDAYGKTDDEFGWEIDHIDPKSKGGTDDLDNLRPLHWENNRARGDNSPFQCKVGILEREWMT